MKYLSVLLLICFLIFNACNRNNSDTKENLSNVFKPLDGKWHGVFKVFIDENGQQHGLAQPQEIDFNILNKPSLKLQSLIEATHIYKSVNPYRQEGEIIDIITKIDGSKDTIRSSVINFVEKDKLKCIVNKPTEKVIHDGKYLDSNTIIWQRKINNPLKIEYFKESVIDNHYKIIGWGYYGKDNPELTPRIWFYADYLKTEH